LGFAGPEKKEPVFAKAMPVDSDGDGVPDTQDDCPGTPKGTPVDARGCPSEENKRVPTNDWVLRDVKFDFDSAQLKPESMAALDQAIQVLRANPSVKVEVQGHTDNIGRQVYNLSLSQRRALAVVKYLLQEGIGADRMVAKGYGDEQPLTSNDTDSGRAVNRRMQFKVLNEKVTQ
jgi:OOP family OmpA-OmpF porin